VLVFVLVCVLVCMHERESCVLVCVLVCVCVYERESEKRASERETKRYLTAATTSINTPDISTEWLRDVLGVAAGKGSSRPVRYLRGIRASEYAPPQTEKAGLLLRY